MSLNDYIKPLNHKSLNIVVMDKENFIRALNSKGFRNSIISHYYNIGRALPFVAQRFPDGRVSPWYANQYVEVHRVEPGGKGGKYGNAYGFLLSQWRAC
jgi:hypothetical protein